MTAADIAFARFRDGGKPEDLAEVFDSCAPQLLLLANHVSGNSGVAEDLVQATFLKAIEAAGRFEPGREVQPWLVGILVREAKKHRRQASRTPDAARLGEHREEPIPDEVAEAHEFQAALSKALDELPQSYREVLTLRLVHGLTPTEIGHARGVSPETIKTQIRRGTERLKKLLPPSFATALVTLAATGFLMAQVRLIVLNAAENAAQAAAAVAGSAGTSSSTTTATTSTAAGLTGAAIATVARSASGGTSTVATGLGLSALRKVGWLVGVGAAATFGVVAWQYQDGQPELDVVEDRVEIPDPRPHEPARRVTATETEKDLEEDVRVDPALAVITGRVVGESGMGLDGMKVDLYRLHPDVLVVPASGLPGSTQAPEFLAGSVDTDDRGRFTFPGLRPSGAFLVVLDADGDRVQWQLVNRTPSPREVIDLGTMLLGRRHVVTGRIIDRNGMPVAGARLRHVGEPWASSNSMGLLGIALEQICSDEFEADGGLVANWAGGRQVLTVPPWFRALFSKVLARTATTDDRGTFTWVTPRKEELTMAISAAGFASARASFKVVGDNQFVGEFKMDRVGKVRGVVRDGFGDPVKGAEVMLGKYGEDASCTPVRLVAQTNQDGEFQVPWDHKFSVLAAVRRRPGDRWHVSGPHAPKDRVYLNMPRGFDVVVRVVERKGSVLSPLTVRPVMRLLPAQLTPNVSTGVLTMHQLGCLEPISLAGRRVDGGEGEVTISGVTAGPWTLIVSAAGHGTKTVSLVVGGNEQVPVELVPLESTAISLDDPITQHPPGLPLFARASGGLDRVFEFPVLIGTTGEEGAIDLPRSRWRRHSIGTATSEMGCCSSEAGPGVDRLAIPMRLRGQIEGRVTEGGESAAPGSWLLMARAVRLPGQPLPALSMPTVFTPVLPYGRFMFPPLEPGHWAIYAIRPKASILHPSVLLPGLFGAEDSEPLETVEVFPRGLQELALETIKPEEAIEKTEEANTESLTFHGSVALTPRPVAGVWVGVERGKTWSWFLANPDGTFDTGIKPSGPMRVAVLAADGSGRKPAPVAPQHFLWRKQMSFAKPNPFTGGKPAVLNLDLMLLPTTFALSTADRRKAAGMDISVEGKVNGSGGEFMAKARTDGSGWFRVDMLAGVYSLRGEHPGLGWIAKKQVAVTMPISLSFHLEPLLVASGSASRAIGVDLPIGSRVDFQRISGGPHRIKKSGFFDLNGRFRVDELLPGKYRVVVHAAQRNLTTGRIVKPRLAKIRIPQGVIDIGFTGRTDVVLSRPR